MSIADIPLAISHPATLSPTSSRAVCKNSLSSLPSWIKCSTILFRSSVQLGCHLRSRGPDWKLYTRFDWRLWAVPLSSREQLAGDMRFGLGGFLLVAAWLPACLCEQAESRAALEPPAEFLAKVPSCAVSAGSLYAVGRCIGAAQHMVTDRSCNLAGDLFDFGCRKFDLPAYRCAMHMHQRGDRCGRQPVYIGLLLPARCSQYAALSQKPPCLRHAGRS